MEPRPVLESSLHVPDDPSWSHTHPLHSDAMAGALNQAYLHLKLAPSDPMRYFAAYATVQPYRDVPLMPQQRLRLEFVLAQAFAGDECYADALKHLHNALELADDLHDHSARIELNLLATGVAFHLIDLVHARGYAADGLEALYGLQRSDDTSVDPSLELDFLTRLASVEYELCDHDAAADYVAVANHVRATWFPEERLRAATIAWIEGQLLRWGGQLAQALTTIMAAAAIYEHEGRPESIGRIATIVAETAHDLAASYADESGTRPLESFVSLAQPYTFLASRCASTARDEIGSSLAQLAQLRGERLIVPHQNRLTTHEEIVSEAQRLGDIALLGQAYSGMAEELATQGQRDTAREHYHRAWRLLQEHELRAMALRPYRALLHLNELDA